MLLHDARSASRLSADGEIVLLEDQDRSLWKRDRIAEGGELVKRALAARPVGPYAVQAAIAAIHAVASYKRAFALTTQEPERRFLQRRLSDLAA